MKILFDDYFLFPNFCLLFLTHAVGGHHQTSHSHKEDLFIAFLPGDVINLHYPQWWDGDTPKAQGMMDDIYIFMYTYI